MTTSARRVNRGPAAAAENRAAILAAARRLFADRGYGVPLSAVAQAAGVGQGVLYRHFPTRLQLAFAVFDEHFTEFDAIAAEPGPEAFGRLWERVLDLTVTDSAFLEMLIHARRTMPDYDGRDRIHALLGATLARAQDAGTVDAALTVEDVMLAWRMAFGVVVTASDTTDLRALVDRALTLRPVRGGVAWAPAGPS
jgi:AcrR family transcriptional regulator